MAKITERGITCFCYDTLHVKYNGLLFVRKGNIFFVFLCLCSGNYTNQSMHHIPDHVWPYLIIPLYYIFLIKVPSLGKHSIKKMK